MLNIALPALGFRQCKHQLLDLFDRQVQFTNGPPADGLEFRVTPHGQRQLRSHLDQHGPPLEQLPKTFLLVIQGVNRRQMAVFMAQVTPQQPGIVGISFSPGANGLPVVMKLMAIEDIHAKPRFQRQVEKRLVILPCRLNSYLRAIRQARKPPTDFSLGIGDLPGDLVRSSDVQGVLGNINTTHDGLSKICHNNLRSCETVKPGVHPTQACESAFWRRDSLSAFMDEGWGRNLRKSVPNWSEAMIGVPPTPAP